MMKDKGIIRSVDFTKEDAILTYEQLRIRLEDFEFMMNEAAKNGNSKRVIEIAKAIESIQRIMQNLLKAII